MAALLSRYPCVRTVNALGILQNCIDILCIEDADLTDAKTIQLNSTVESRETSTSAILTMLQPQQNTSHAFNMQAVKPRLFVSD